MKALSRKSQTSTEIIKYFIIRWKKIHFFIIFTSLFIPKKIPEEPRSKSKHEHPRRTRQNLERISRKEVSLLRHDTESRVLIEKMNEL